MSKEKLYKAGLKLIGEEFYPTHLTEDQVKGMEMLKQAALQGHAEAAEELCPLYFSQSCLRDKSHELVYWYLAAGDDSEERILKMLLRSNNQYKKIAAQFIQAYRNENYEKQLAEFISNRTQRYGLYFSTLLLQRKHCLPKSYIKQERSEALKKIFLKRLSDKLNEEKINDKSLEESYDPTYIPAIAQLDASLFNDFCNKFLDYCSSLKSKSINTLVLTYLALILKNRKYLEKNTTKNLAKQIQQLPFFKKSTKEIITAALQPEVNETKQNDPQVNQFVDNFVFHYLQDAAQPKNGEALYTFATAYENGGKLLSVHHNDGYISGFKQDKNLAAKYFQQSAEAGYPKGEYEHGERLLSTDKNKALKFLRSAARKGNMDAQQVLANNEEKLTEKAYWCLLTQEKPLLKEVSYFNTSVESKSREARDLNSFMFAYITSNLSLLKDFFRNEQSGPLVKQLAHIILTRKHPSNGKPVFTQSRNKTLTEAQNYDKETKKMLRYWHEQKSNPTSGPNKKTTSSLDCESKPSQSM